MNEDEQYNFEQFKKFWKGLDYWLLRDLMEKEDTAMYFMYCKNFNEEAQADANLAEARRLIRTQ